jgi:uncharacterized protein (TIGR00730 family)
LAVLYPFAGKYGIMPPMTDAPTAAGALKRLCAFCGSSPGARPEYAAAARALGRELLRRGTGLVYGGGRVGLMYELARVVHEGGGEVIGVIPRGMVDRELAYTGIRDLRVVETMHERKALMAGLADGFVALPGGLGTIEETFEVLTWAQLGMHRKPCGFLNTAGYFDSLLAFLDNAREERFVQAEHRGMIVVAPEPAALLDLFEAYVPPEADMARWALDMSKT